ncbi:MAG TPA: FtsW/RodA/SpoVE family cell cycle protein [Synergistales bacterium]|jgi:cell division protein FtsW|nr:FtsW/RodA/SpoVE family cell cycle protein [Synergistales bacterium]HRV70540.1 FtsW/RodA/SpoVE family cell cycle protein [Thermovirgaceae bacterium]
MQAKVDQIPARHRPLWGLAIQGTWVIPLVLSCIGILMISSVTAQLTVTQGRTPFYYGLRQIKWLGAGLVMMIACTVPTTEFWKKWSGVIWLGSLFLMVFTLIPGIGREGGGSNRWVRFGPFSIQASEVMLLTFALHLTKKLREAGLDRKKGMARTIVLFVLSSWPFAFQPDLGGALIMFVLSMGIYVQVFGWFLPIVAGISAMIGLFVPFVFLSRYRFERLMAFHDPWKDPLGSGFQTLQGFVAFANGGGFGVGIGHGLQKLQYLPAAHTDFILAVIGEELGLAGTFTLVILFGVFFLIQFLSYLTLDDDFDATLVWAMTLAIFIPFMVNAGGVLRILPLTGVPLPFVSYGGSSLVLGWCKVGILLRLLRNV